MWRPSAATCSAHEEARVTVPHTPDDETTQPIPAVLSGPSRDDARPDEAVPEADATQAGADTDAERDGSGDTGSADVAVTRDDPALQEPAGDRETETVSFADTFDEEATTRIEPAEPPRVTQADPEETTRITVVTGEADSGEETTRIAAGDEPTGATTRLNPDDSGDLRRLDRIMGTAADPGRAPLPKQRKKLSPTQLVIAILVALLGFALVVQVRGSSTDSTLASARQDDLVRILSDLDSNENRLRTEIADLDKLKSDLTAGSESAQAAKQAAEKRADELGILAGTLPAKGPGLVVKFNPGAGQIRASRLLDAVEELRNAGAEGMQISGSDGQTVRIIVSTYFVDDGAGVRVDGAKLTGPYTITVIGDAPTMKTALNIPGGVVAAVGGDGGNVIVEDPGTVSVTALAATPDLQYAQPVS
jgi:uncharacterized protein YlxW (UPF0749 family)